MDEFSSRIYGYAMRYTKDRQESSDLVQDVFAALWENRKKVPMEKAKAWLFTTAHNRLINLARRKKRVRFASLEFLDVMDGSKDAAKDLENRDMVDKLIEHLPSVQRSVLLLRDLEGYSYQDIGDLLQLSESQVKVYLFRARKKIKAKLEELTLVL